MAEEPINQERGYIDPLKEGYRQLAYPAHPLFPRRWSPRAMSGEKITEEQLMTLFEAAKWAPSSYNNQHWRFLYANRSSTYWQTFLDLLVESNRRWAKDAAVLLVILSKKTFDHNQEFSKTHSFDTGAAWENLALQGSLMGLVVHGMQGFDYQRARKELNVPEKYEVEAMAAVGRPGDKEELPDSLQENEYPNQRKSISQLVTEGTFASDW